MSKFLTITALGVILTLGCPFFEVVGVIIFLGLAIYHVGKNCYPFNVE